MLWVIRLLVVPCSTQAAWIEQVGALPAEKREAAFDLLQQETGLSRGELGLPPRAKQEL